LQSQKEIERRYRNLRVTMEKEGMDALIVCGNQYAGFEGAVLYTSGFEIVHRYVYVVLPLEGEPTLVFPREARWIGDKAKPWVKDHVWPDVPGSGSGSGGSTANGNELESTAWISSWPYGTIGNWRMPPLSWFRSTFISTWREQ
jgi:hypothetical protein